MGTNDDRFELYESNEARIHVLEEAAGPQGEGSMENAFDALRMLTFIEHIVEHLGIAEMAETEFEWRRAMTLTKIEARYQEMLDAKEAAERQARLAGGPVGRRAGVPQRPGPGGIVIPGPGNV